jgi:maltose O-acetyltransferase
LNSTITIGDAFAVLRAQWYLRKADHVGPKVRLWGQPSIQNRGTLVIGERVRLVSTTAKLELATGTHGRLEIGNSTFINYGCSISAHLLVEIGQRCIIGTYVMIIDNQFHNVDPERRLEMPASAAVTIGENVWLGGHVIVLPGVTIGEHSAVGAGSVVTQNIPPRSLAAGVPAKVLRKL